MALDCPAAPEAPVRKRASKNVLVSLKHLSKQLSRASVVLLDPKYNEMIVFWTANPESITLCLLILYFQKHNMIKAQLMCCVMERWHPHRSVSHCVYLSILCKCNRIYPPPCPHHHTERVSNPGCWRGRRALYQGG